MQQVITLGVGQAGCQIGSAIWETLCLEHGLSADGYVVGCRPQGGDGMGGCCGGAGPLMNNMPEQDDSHKAFFTETSQGKLVPRCAFFDLEPSVVDELKKGTYCQLFHPEYLVTGNEDAANNYARGHYTVGKDIIERCVDTVRKMAENCDTLTAFFMTNSVGGGTGSGLGSLLLERLGSDYGRKPKINFCVWPSAKISTAVVEPYNSVLTTHAHIEHTDISILLDNEALYSICHSNLGVQHPSYPSLNRMIAQVVSSMTTSIRFDGNLNVDLQEFQTNLVPYPRVHFCVASYAPLMTTEAMQQAQITPTTLLKDAMNPKTHFVKYENGCTASKQLLHMAVVLLFRGDVTNKDVNTAQNAVKNDTRFVEWSPCGFKVGINYQPPPHIPATNLAKTDKGLVAIMNNCNVKDVFGRMDYKFDLMFKRRAFVHWYVGEGMEEGEFDEAREDLATLEVDYQQIVEGPPL